MAKTDSEFREGFSSYNYLYEFELDGIGRVYHLLPGISVSQESNCRKIQSKKFRNEYLFQKDGSRFNYIRMPKTIREMSRNDVKEKINAGLKYDHFSEQTPIMLKNDDNGISSFLKKLVESSELDNYYFLFYWTHTFLNGLRGIPILVDTNLNCFYDLSSSLGRENIPQDSIGIMLDVEEASLVDFVEYAIKMKLLMELEKVVVGENIRQKIINEINSKKVVKINLIDYRSILRVCPCCGVVSDVTKPRVNPFESYKTEVVREANREKRRVALEKFVR